MHDDFRAEADSTGGISFGEREASRQHCFGASDWQPVRSGDAIRTMLLLLLAAAFDSRTLPPSETVAAAAAVAEKLIQVREHDRAASSQRHDCQVVESLRGRTLLLLLQRHAAARLPVWLVAKILG